MVDAGKYEEYRDGKLPAVRHAFNAASKNDMYALGEAFAEVAFEHAADQPQSVLRIGIVGVQDSGKTVFVDGILSTVPDKEKKEEPNDKSGLQPQALWHSERAGWIRQYDAHFDSAGTCFRSYFQNITAPYTPMLTDIVEHPQRDMHNKQFDYLVLIQHKTKSSLRNDPRIVMVIRDPQQSETPGMRKFLEAVKTLRAGP